MLIGDKALPKARVFSVFDRGLARAGVRRSVTTNLGYEQWTGILGPARLTGAALDRFAHRCVIVETTGESCRLHDAKQRRRSEPKS
ncbi:MAG: ATP-binding protein [Gemmataceae bacterium]